MRLETFLEKFDIFAEAPCAVAKMRELVLELAVQGKLSEHRATDAKDPAWLKLAQQLDAEPSAPVSDVEPPFDIPSWWRWSTLESLGDTRPRNDAPDGATSSFVPMTLIPVGYGQRSRHEERPWGEIKKGYTHFQNGDVVMAKITPCFENGKSAVMMNLTGGFGAGTTELHVFRRSGDTVLPEFVIVYLKTREFITRGEARMTGSAGQKRVPYDYFARSPFPLPPFAEQKRIVAKVDELMALCDQLEAQQQERETRHAALARASLARFVDAPTPANLSFLFHTSYAIAPDELRKSILTLAVQGRLVPQNPNDEPAVELTKRVTAEKLRLVKAKEIKSEVQLDDIADEEVLPIPDSWIWLRAGNLCRPISSGSTPDQSVFHASEGIPYLKVYNIRNQMVDFDYKRQFIAESHHKERMKRSTLRPGDVIMNIVGPPLGKVAIVPDTFPEWNCNQAISFFRPVFPEMSPYLYTFLKEGSFLRNIQLIGTAGQDNISVTKCKFIPVPIPPVAEQSRIVAKVQQLMALVDELETQLTASRATAANLLTAIVAELTGTTRDGKVAVTFGSGKKRRGSSEKSRRETIQDQGLSDNWL